MGELTIRVTRKNKNIESDLPLTISAQDGLIAQDKFFGKKVASKNLQNYLLLRKGEFAYNKSYSNGYPYGSIKRLNKYDYGVISSLYIAFSPKSVNSSFLEQYYDSSKWYKEIYTRATEGARNHGLLNIAPADFFDSNILVPTSSLEQEKIGRFIEKVNHTINLHEEKLAQLQQLKKGLLQKMFADNNQQVPVLRFNGFDDAWEQHKLGDIASIFSGGTPSISHKEYYGGNIPFIRSAEINSKTTELFLTEQGLNNSSAKRVESGDILYALYGATSGEVGISKINGAINQAILDIKPSEEYNSYFIMQWLRNNKSRIVNTYLQGGQGNLSGKIIKELMISSPKTKEQQKIGIFLQKLDTTITLHQRELDTLKKVKKYLLQNLFI